MSLLTRTAFCSLAVGAVVVMSGLAACGDDDDGGEPLSDGEFVEQGNAICTAGTAETDEMGDDLGNDPSEDEVGDYLMAVIETLRGQLGELDDLNAPEDKADAVAQLIDDARSTLDDLEEQVDDDVNAVLAAEEDPFTEVNEQFDALGLTECS